jgi:hypothetical protein
MPSSASRQYFSKASVSIAPTFSTSTKLRELFFAPFADSLCVLCG